MKQRLALACGGTLGHVTPALVVADACARAHPAAPPVLFTVKGDPPIDLVRASGYEVVELTAGPFARATIGGQLSAIGRLGLGFREARARLRTGDVAAVLSFGGYAGAALALAARSLGLPAYVHEGNVRLGLSNRLAVTAGVKPLLTWAETQAECPTAPTVGFPARPPVGVARFPRDDAPIELVVTGGSGGSPDLNTLAPKLLGATGLGARLRVVHQCGDVSSVGAVAAAYEARGLSATVTPFLEDIPSALERASFAIACPGAATLAELAAAGLPSLVVPRADAARRHQHANARLLALHGAGHVLDSPADLHATAAAIASVLRDESRWTALSRAIGELHRPQAARRILEIVEAGMGQANEGPSGEAS